MLRPVVLRGACFTERPSETASTKNLPAKQENVRELREGTVCPGYAKKGHEDRRQNMLN